MLNLFTNENPAAIGSNPKPFAPLEVKPVIGNPFPGHMGFKQVRSVGHYPVEAGGVYKDPARAGILPFDGLDQFPCAHAVKFSGKRNVKIAAAVAKIDVKY